MRWPTPLKNNTFLCLKLWDAGQWYEKIARSRDAFLSFRDASVTVKHVCLARLHLQTIEKQNNLMKKTHDFFTQTSSAQTHPSFPLSEYGHKWRKLKLILDFCHLRWFRPACKDVNLLSVDLLKCTWVIFDRNLSLLRI